MAKLDKSQYTKAEWQDIRDQRRREKQQEKQQYSYPAPTPVAMAKAQQDKNYILCLKHGVKYNYDYVNKLYNMVSRHCTLDFEFVCLTDNTQGLDPNIKTIPLPDYLEGWWCKPYMYSNDLPLSGTILYMDLDVVISNNIDKLFTYEPDHWCVIRDFTRKMRPKWTKYNSSIVRFKTGQLSHVWENFKKDQKQIQHRLFGDQDWLYEATRDTQAMLWPDSWIQSWKWEVRTEFQFFPGGLKGNRKFKNKENVIPRIECCVCVFHGDPNPHNCDDPWVVDNWK